MAALNIPPIESVANVRSQIPLFQPSKPDNMSKGENQAGISTSKSTQDKGKGPSTIINAEADPAIAVAKEKPQDQLFVDFLKRLWKEASKHYYRFNKALIKRLTWVKTVVARPGVK